MRQNVTVDQLLKSPDGSLTHPKGRNIPFPQNVTVLGWLRLSSHRWMLVVRDELAPPLRPLRVMTTDAEMVSAPMTDGEVVEAFIYFRARPDRLTEKLHQARGDFSVAGSW